jgi:hypothetical protein
VLVSQLTVRAVHLDDAHASAAQELRQSDAVTAGALDAVGLHATVALGPVVQLLVALRIGADAQLAESGPVLVKGHGHVDVFMGIDADDHVTCAIGVC